MYGIILTAHSQYSSGVYSGLKLIAGEAENIRVVDYLENQSYQDLDANLKLAYEQLRDYDGVIFITDLLGGTPFSRSVLNFSDIKNVRVLTGLNFSLLYAAAFIEPGLDMDKDIQEIIETGKSAITVYKSPEKKQEENIQDDGI